MTQQMTQAKDLKAQTEDRRRFLQACIRSTAAERSTQASEPGATTDHSDIVSWAAPQRGLALKPVSPGGGDLSAPDINSLGSALAEETSSVLCGASLCAAWWCSNEGFPVAFQEEEH